MDCVACDKLEKINIDMNERIQKAMLYEKFLNTSAVKKFKFNNLQVQSFPIYNQLKMNKLKIYLIKNLLIKYF